jgi:hypothetical protein
MAGKLKQSLVDAGLLNNIAWGAYGFYNDKGGWYGTGRRFKWEGAVLKEFPAAKMKKLKSLLKRRLAATSVDAWVGLKYNGTLIVHCSK